MVEILKTGGGNDEIIGVSAEDEFQLAPRIKIIGVGGAGSNMAEWLYNMNIQGAEVIAANTDYAHLKTKKAHKRILLGKEITRGLGAGGQPSVGMEAAKATQAELRKLLEGTDMLWILLGLGGGTGTGAGPVIAKVAKEVGVPLVIGVATLPLASEGLVRREKAEEGLAELRKYCDTVVLLDNDKIRAFAGNLHFIQAFGFANQMIGQMIKGIIETVTTPSYINLDFADLKTVFSTGGGAAIVGIGIASGEKAAETAAKRALENPLLSVDYQGATGALVHVEGGNLTLEDIDKALGYIQKNIGPDALTIAGARHVEELRDQIRVTTIITGVKSPYVLARWREEYEKRLNLVKNKELGIEVLE